MSRPPVSVDRRRRQAMRALELNETEAKGSCRYSNAAHCYLEKTRPNVFTQTLSISCYTLTGSSFCSFSFFLWGLLTIQSNVKLMARNAVPWLLFTRGNSTWPYYFIKNISRSSLCRSLYRKDSRVRSSHPSLVGYIIIRNLGLYIFISFHSLNRARLCKLADY